MSEARRRGDRDEAGQHRARTGEALFDEYFREVGPGKHTPERPEIILALHQDPVKPERPGAQELPLDETIRPSQRGRFEKIMPPLSDDLAEKMSAARKAILEYRVKKGDELARYLNDNAREPLPVIKAALKDKGAVVFLGDYHTYGGSENPMREYCKTAVEASDNDLVLAVEVPDILKPVFDKFNKSGPGMEMEVPEYLEVPGSSEALADLRRLIKDKPELYQSWKDAHDRGEIVAPKEVPAVLKPLFDKFNESKPGSKLEIPDHLEVPLCREALKELRGMIKEWPDLYATWKAARDHGAVVVPIDNDRILLSDNHPRRKESDAQCNEHMKDHLIELMDLYPGRTIAYQAGSMHCCRDGNAEHDGSRPAAFLLEQDPRFQFSGRHIVSFASLVADGDNRRYALSDVASLAQYPFLVPTRNGDRPTPVGELSIFLGERPYKGKLSGFDYEVFCPKGVDPKMKREGPPIVGVDIDEDRVFLAKGVEIPAPLTRTLDDLLAQDEPAEQKLAGLKHFINTEAKDPVAEVPKHLQGDSIVLMSYPSHPDQNDLKFSWFPKYFEALSQEIPQGTKLAIEYPAELKPVFDAFNNSPPGTKFEIPEQIPSVPKEMQEGLLQALKITDPSIFRLWETAHNNGMTIHPVDNRTMVTRDPEEARVLGGRRSADLHNQIAKLTADDPKHPVLALLDFSLCAASNDQNMPSAFYLLQRDRGLRVTNILIHDQTSRDLTLSSFIEDLSRPVLLDTRSKGRVNLLGRIQAYADAEWRDRGDLSSFAEVIIFPSEYELSRKQKK